MQELSVIVGDSRLTGASPVRHNSTYVESGQADSRVDSAVRQLAAGWEELAAIDPAALSGEELLDLLDLLETDTRRRTAVACG